VLAVKQVPASVLTLVLVLSAVGQHTPHSGFFSRTATCVWSRSDAVTIAAPDKTKAIEVTPILNPKGDATTVVSVRAYGRKHITKIGAWVNAEAAWSPDSKAFFVTYSDGGNVGTYHVKIFYVEPSGLRAIEPIPNGRRLFPPTCFDNELPNVGAIRWGTGSARLVIAVEVPPHSSCASMGTFRAFEISLPAGQVLKRYGQLQAKRMFSDSIGGELRKADDDCVRRPSTCIPNGMNVPAGAVQR